MKSGKLDYFPILIKFDQGDTRLENCTMYIHGEMIVKFILKSSECDVIQIKVRFFVIFIICPVKLS